MKHISRHLARRALAGAFVGMFALSAMAQDFRIGFVNTDRIFREAAIAKTARTGDADRLFPTPELDSRLTEQKRNLDNLLQRYTEQHPDVVSTRRLIVELEKQKKKEVAELRKAALQLGGLAMPLLWGLFAFLSSFVPFLGITAMTIALTVAGIILFIRSGRKATGS